MRLPLAVLLLAGPAVADDFIPPNPLRAAQEGANAVPVPASRPVGRHPVPVFDRSMLPRTVLARAAEARANTLADAADPKYIRFKLPKLKAYVERIARRLTDGSGLEPVTTLVNDTSWGAPGASMTVGILQAEPEGVALMENEDEAAAIFAHELAHHARAHDERLIAKVGSRRDGGGDIFDRQRPSQAELEARWTNEAEADELSVLILTNAGYDPGAALDALRRVAAERARERTGFPGVQDLSHPPLATREGILRGAVARHGLRPVARTPLDAEVWRECRDRRRSDKPEDVPASQLFKHYRERPR